MNVARRGHRASMSPSQRRRLTLLALVLLVILVPSPSSDARSTTALAGAPLTQSCTHAIALRNNLIVNGNAEADSGAPNDVAITPVSCWTTTSNFTAIRYGAFGSSGYFPAQHTIPNGGANFFGGGPNTASASATQIIDVSSLAGAIDTGGVTAALSGFVGGYNAQNDNMVVSATFQSATQGILGSVQIGPILAAERSYGSDLLPRLATAPLPTSTRTIAVVMRATRTSGSYDDGYADNLSLVLSAEGPAPTTPLIVIPGIMGSNLRLNNNRTNELWPAPFGNPGKQNLKLPSNLNIVATDAMRVVVFRNYYQPLLDSLVQAGYKTYPENPTKTPLESCQAHGADVTLYVFAYDWRQDIKEGSASPITQLKQLVDCVRGKHAGSKVDLVAHSMGGLVARSYILANLTQDAQENYTHSIDKLITIATPWLGAPKALNVLRTGDAFDAAPSAVLRVSSTDIRNLVETFPGTHELLPSKAYFDLGGRPFVKVDEEGKGTAYNYDQYAHSLDALSTHPVATNQAFHTQRQDDWSGDSDRTGVLYYHIYGLKKTDDTITVIQDQADVDCKVAQCSAMLVVQPGVGPGDGTVPTLSALRMNGTRDLNARTDPATLWAARAGRGDGDAEHLGLTQNPNVQACVLFVLQPVGRSCGLGEVPRTRATSAVQSEPPSQPAYYLNVRGVRTVTLSDVFGNTTDTLNGTLTEPVPDVAAYRLGDQAQMLIMPTDQIYTATLRSDAAPLAIEIRQGTGDTTTMAIRYRDLVLPPNVTALLKLTPQGVENLRYDADGDGLFETVVTPIAIVSGAAASDITPPAITVSQAGPLDNTSISLSATDSSGVGGIFYSLDGKQFQSYTSPLQVNAFQTPFLYAFANDNVANRSSLITYQIAKQIYLPFTRR